MQLPGSTSRVISGSSGGTGQIRPAIEGHLNDLWEFSPATGELGDDEWIQYSQPACRSGHFAYTSRRKHAGTRSSAVVWTDSKGNVWLFGGTGIDDTAGAFAANLNDLWEYNPNTNEWAWMSGVASTSTWVANQAGVYGSLQIPDATNVPGSRIQAIGWTDSSGNLWLFGGVGADSAGDVGFLNDLWQFNTTTNEWTWMGGSSSTQVFCPIISNWCGQLGVYGTLQTPSLTNVPGGRYDSVGWTDAHGNLWLFGGSGLDGVGYAGSLNDLWEYQPGSAGLPVAATPVISPGTGTYTTWQTVTMTDATPWATIQYEINGAPPVLTYTAPITVNSSETIEAWAFASGDANSALTIATYTANLPTAEAPTFSPSSETFTTAQTVTIADGTPGATIYYAIGAAPTLASSVYTGPITVSSSEIVEAMAVASGYQNSTVSTSTYNMETSSTNADWTWMGGSSAVASSCYTGTVGYFLQCARPGWYGTLGQGAAGNIPGGRLSGQGWTDSSGRFWIFGGLGYDSAGNNGYLNDLWMFDPSTARWTWMGGSSALTCSATAGCGQPGVYGTLGTPAATNVPGGRAWATGWTDESGHFWLLGGKGFDSQGHIGYLNDLWEFDPSSRQWTWQGGSSTLSVVVYGTWGASGVYGSIGVPAAGEVPGSRGYAAGWIDANGDFWLYGGEGYDSRGDFCYPNDLWEFNVAQKQWIWQAGSKFCVDYEAGYSGDYGPLGTPAIGSSPWSLASPSTFTDSSGHLWLFGGDGNNGVSYPLNDVWEFYPGTDEWAWESANSAGGSGTDVGSYGTQDSWTAMNIPNGRWASASWTDLEGNFWLFSGYGAPNDLWEFKPSINEWSWVGGSSTWGLPGVYGTLGSPAAGNIPGLRAAATTWTDSKGNLWLFGGQGFDAQAADGYLNDLWQYGVSSPPGVVPPAPAAQPTFSMAAGSYTSTQTLTISDQTPGATIYYTTNGTTPNIASSVYSGQITVSSSETIQAVAVAGGYANSSVASSTYTITLPAAATPTLSLASGTYTGSQTVTLGDTTAGATIYYTTNGTAPTTNSTVYNGAITVSTSETIEAMAVASGYANSAVASATYTINLPAPTFTFGASPTSLTVNSGSQGSTTSHGNAAERVQLHGEFRLLGAACGSFVLG